MILSHYPYGMQNEQRLIRRRRAGVGVGDYLAYQQGEIPDVVGGVTAADQVMALPTVGINWNAVATGLATGVGVWFITKMMDRIFKITK